MNRRTGSVVNRRITVLRCCSGGRCESGRPPSVFAGVAFIKSKSDRSAGRQSQGAVQRRHPLREYALRIGTHWH